MLAGLSQSRDNGSCHYKTIAGTVPNDGTQQITAPAPPVLGEEYQISFRSLVNHRVYDLSAPFVIVGATSTETRIRADDLGTDRRTYASADTVNTFSDAGTHQDSPTIYFCYFRGLQRSDMITSRSNPSLAHSWYSERAEMAAIRDGYVRCHVQIRKNGYPAATETLTSITPIKKWVKATESDMEYRLFKPVSDITVGEILAHDERIILPKHKGACRHESYRIKRLKAAFGNEPASDLRAFHLVNY